MPWLIYTLMAVGALALAVWGWRGDRARGRRRCPKCWYDLRGSPTLRCPECGHVAWTERDLYRPRRRKWALWLAAVILVATPSYWAYTTVRAHGWPALLPNWALVWLSPQREYGRSVIDWHYEYAVDEELRRRGYKVDPDDLPDLIRDKRIVFCRERWPLGVRLAIGIERPYWLRGARLVVEPEIERSEPADIGDSSSFISSSGFQGLTPLAFVGVPTRLGRGITLNCQLWERSFKWQPNPAQYRGKMVWTDKSTLDVEIVEGYDDVLTPVDSPALSAAFRAAFEVISFDNWKDAGPAIEFALDRTVSPLLEDIAIGFGLDLVSPQGVMATRLVRRQDLGQFYLFDSPEYGKPWDAHFQTPPEALLWCEDLDWNDPACDCCKSDPNTWTLRIRGDREAALTDWTRDKYWAGSFEIPVADLLSE